MSTTLLPGLRATSLLLVLAATGEVVEQLISPLDGSSTAKDLAAIATHQGRFELSVVIGVVSTLLYAPALLGLALACLPRSQRLAPVAGWTAVAAMGGFMGIRMGQALELSGIRSGLDRHALAATIDNAGGNPIGALVLVVFLGGALVGLVMLAVVGWRAGLPKLACAGLAAFQVVDFVAPQRPPFSHLLLLASLTWIATVLWRRGHVAAPETAAMAVV